MITSNEQAETPGTSAIDNSSDAAGLLDEAFMNQFAPIDPQELYYQSALDDWFSGNLTNDLNSFPDGTKIFEDSRALEDSFHHNSDTPDNLHLCQAADKKYGSQIVENSSGFNGINRNVPHLSSIEQVLHDIVQIDAHPTPRVQQFVFDNSQPDGIQDWQKRTDPYEVHQPEDLDKEWEVLQRSLQYSRDFEELFGFQPDSQCNDLVDGLITLDSAQNQPTGQPQGALNQFDDFELVSGGPSHQCDNELRFKPQNSISITPRKYQLEVVPEEPHVSSNLPYQPTPANFVPVKRLPLPTKIEKAQRKEPLNNRRANMESVDSSQYYEKLPEAPHSWSPYDTNCTSIFQYDEYGELAPDDKFSPEQIYQYLFHHPLNYDKNGNYDIANSRLILWIQVTPADSGRRYPYLGSSKCRFQDCPAPQNTIRKGFFRVAFDETTATGRQVDPYHCAAFVHLFCLEKFCDFPAICQKFNVLPDQRSLPEGRNKMGITRDHHEMSEVVDTFMKSAQTPIPWDYEKTLCFQLTSKHLELEPSARKALRAARGGNHIAIHKGDIDRFVEGEGHKVARQRVTGRAPKRKREVGDEEEVSGKLTKKDIPPRKNRYRFR